MAQQAQQLNPGYAPLLRRLVATRVELLKNTTDSGKRRELEQQILSDLNSIVAANPDDRDSSLQLARLLVIKCDPLLGAADLSRAENMVRRFVDSSGYADEQAVKLLVDTKLKQREIDAAEEELERGLKRTPDAEILRQASAQIAIERQLAHGPSGEEKTGRADSFFGDLFR